MNTLQFIEELTLNPEKIEFAQTIETIENDYIFTATAFNNGGVSSKAGSNEGSCKILAFAQLNKLSKDQTLACFGHYYREDVLGYPEGEDHANIRQLMRTGLDAVSFDAFPLKPR